MFSAKQATIVWKTSQTVQMSILIMHRNLKRMPEELMAGNHQADDPKTCFVNGHRWKLTKQISPVR